MSCPHAIQDLLKLMDGRTASDLILTAGAAPQLKVNGILENVGDQILFPEDTRELANEILTTEQREVFEKRKYIDFSHAFKNSPRFRVNIFYQRESVALAIRMIPIAIPTYEELSLPDIVREFAMEPHGLVLITGPAGSGKSTTMAAMINQINDTRHSHIICIEDPIEYLHMHQTGIVEQREIGDDARSFTEALHCVFRQAPDVIMIGEMRDLETMQLALTLAETGHLILATLHTQDTTHAINRIVDSFPSNQQQQVYVQLSLVLRGIISQQLMLAKDGGRRVLACETLRVTNAVRNMIREMELQQIYSVIQTGKSEGMITMDESLMQLVQAGLVEEDVARQRAGRPKEFARLMERHNTKRKR